MQDGIHFIVTLAGKAYTWVVKGLTQIGKFVSWIFKKVLALSEELVRWLGFLFEWNDILKTQQTIIRFTNEAITGAVNFLDTAKDEVDQFFGDLKQKVQKSLGGAFPDSVNSTTADGAASKSAMASSPNNSVQGNWSRYQVSHTFSLCYTSTGDTYYCRSFPTGEHPLRRRSTARQPATQQPPELTPSRTLSI